VTTGYSDEPTGAGLQPAGPTLFITDDTGTRSLYVVEGGGDGLVGTSDDTSSQIDVGALAVDPEDPVYHVIEGVVYFLSGVDREILRVTPNDGVFGNGNDTITSFDISHLGPTDFEGLTHAPNRGTLYVAARADDQIFEITTTGTLLRTINVNIPGMAFISGLAMAPSSANASVPSLYFVDRAADAQNDGMMYEIAVPDLDDPGTGNTPPFASDDSAITSQDTPITIDVLANDFDSNGDPLSVDGTTAPANGTVAINADNTVTYTPNAGFVGNDAFTYQASDGAAVSNSATVTITVTGPNQPPTAGDDAAATNQDTSVSIDVLANDTDPLGDPLVVAAVSAPGNGTSSINGDDTITYTPNAGFFGTDSFTYDVCDNGGLCDTGAVTVTVREGQPQYYVSVDTSTSIPGIAETVRDEDIVVYDATSSTWAMFFDASDVGITSGDLDAFHIRDDGSILISYSSDGLIIPGMTGGPEGEAVDDSDLFLFTPTSTGDVTAGSFSFYFDGSDVGLVDVSEDVVGVFEFNDGSLGITTNGGFEVPGLAPGDQEDIHKFSGSFGATTSGTWSLFFDGSDVGFTASTDLNGIFLAGDLFFSTEPGYSAAGGSGDDDDVSRFTGTFGDSTSGTASMVFDAAAAGLDPVLIVDGLHVGNIDTGSENVAPVLDPIGPQSIDEQVELSFTATASDSDVPAQTLTFSLADGATGSVPAGATINPTTGVFSWTPTETQDGSYTFDVVVTDNGTPNL
ncbi:MAG TPA: Ig-like domain-containing protein, partial [Acidimicrobiia bacterium]